MPQLRTFDIALRQYYWLKQGQYLLPLTLNCTDKKMSVQITIPIQVKPLNIPSNISFKSYLKLCQSSKTIPNLLQTKGELICFEEDKLYPGCGLMWSFTLRMYVASSTETHLTFNLRRPHDGATCSLRILQAAVDNDFVIALCSTAAAYNTLHI